MPGGFRRAMDGESETPSSGYALASLCPCKESAFLWFRFFWRLPKEMNSAFRPKALDLDLELELELELEVDRDLEVDLGKPRAKNNIKSFRLKAGHFL